MHSTRVIYAEVDGPTGPLLLTSDGSALTGLYHRGQKWGREPDDSWLLDDAPPLKAGRWGRRWGATPRRSWCPAIG